MGKIMGVDGLVDLLRLLLRILCALGIAALWGSTCAVAADEVEVVLDLYHVAGNLTGEQRDNLLASPDWKISASYAPSLKIPGVTASWGRCGFLSLPCLQEHSEDIVLTGSAIRRQGTELRFKLPRHVGVGRFRLSYVNVALPRVGLTDESGLEAYFFMEPKDGGVHSAPVIMQAHTFFLAGTLRVVGASFRSRHSCPESGFCWKQVDDGRYLFQPSHRYAQYRIGMLFPGKEALPLLEPLPDDLRGLKIYHATMVSRVVDGRRIDFVDISATANRDDCFSDDLKYEILYVDGQAIDYTRNSFDTDPGRCRGHHVHLTWGNDGKPIAFRRGATDWIDHGSAVTSFSWNAGCSAVIPGNYQDCSAAAPTAGQESEILADAVRVRRWFVR